jgi:hypothetical protein
MTEQEAIMIIQAIPEKTWERMTPAENVAIEKAVKSMEKQIPKKPKHSGDVDNEGVFHPINGISGVPYDLCPNCQTNLCTDGFLGRNKKSMKHCENCGQKLDWSDEE